MHPGDLGCCAAEAERFPLCMQALSSYMRVEKQEYTNL